MFGQVTVGKQGEVYGSKELESIVDHLGSEIEIIDRFSSSEQSDIENLQIHIGNVALLGDLIDRGPVDPKDVRRNTANPDYSLIDKYGLDIPEYMSLDSSNVSKELKSLGFRGGVKVTEKFVQTIEENNPEIMPRLQLHLGRIAGIGYYRHICYKLTAGNSREVTIPIADGGSTEWATKVTDNKQLYTVASGIGTELVAQHLLAR